MVEEFVLYFEMKICLKIIGQPLVKLYYFIDNIVSDLNCVLNGEHRLSPSNLRYQVARCHGIRLKHTHICAPVSPKTKCETSFYVGPTSSSLEHHLLHVCCWICFRCLSSMLELVIIKAGRRVMSCVFLSDCVLSDNANRIDVTQHKSQACSDNKVLSSCLW